jgi:hypothetical protein
VQEDSFSEIHQLVPKAFVQIPFFSLQECILPYIIQDSNLIFRNIKENQE